MMLAANYESLSNVESGHLPNKRNQMNIRPKDIAGFPSVRWVSVPSTVPLFLLDFSLGRE